MSDSTDASTESDETEAALEQRPSVRGRKRRAALVTGVALAGLLIAVWAMRAPIADTIVADQLGKRGVRADYVIEGIGWRTQRLRDVVIGDPRRPDLTARRVEVDIGYNWSGPVVEAVRADGVRLYGEVRDGKLLLGELDKLRDPTSTDPLALPDLEVKLADARARIATPWGAVGARLEGTGNLRRSFDGELAVMAPRLDLSGCTARDFSFYGDIGVTDSRPRLSGPLRASSTTCPDLDLAVASPAVALEVRSSEDLRRWRGTAALRTQAARLAGARLRTLTADATFSTDGTKTDVELTGSGQSLAMAQISAGTVAIDAEASLGPGEPGLAGNVRVSRAVLASGLRQSIVAGGQGIANTPIGPLGIAATQALTRALSDFDGSAAFSLAGSGRTRRLDIVHPGIVGRSGARLSGDADSRLSLLLAADRPTFLIDGRWRIGGGGLPAGQLALRRARDGSLSGTADFAPYTVGNSRLDLSPLRFAGNPQGTMRITTQAALSGPVGDGRIEALRMPLDVVVAANGAVALRGGCTPVSLQSAEVSGFRLGQNRLTLCSAAGQPLLAYGPGGLRGRVSSGPFAIGGAQGSTPVVIAGQQARLDLATMQWAASLLDIRVGTGDAGSNFTVAALDGRRGANGMAGQLSGATAEIGTIPLLMSDIAGTWRWAGPTIALDGGLTLSDADPDPRFFPLVSKDATLTYRNGLVTAKAGFAEARTGTPVLTADIAHRFKGSVGSADLTVDNLRFNEAFQPDQLTRLALGVVANVKGSVVGKGRIDWSGSGVTSSGTFSTAGTDLAAAFGPVQGLTTTIEFDDLLGLHTREGQRARIDTVNPGIPVVDGYIDYQLLGDNRVRIEGGRWPLAGGELRLLPTTLDFNADRTRRLTFDLTGVDASAFLQQFQFDNIAATGVFDGTLPVEFDGLGARVVGGRLDARSGGTLAYVGELTNQNLGVFANFAFDALKSLKYDDLTIILNGDLDGEMVTDIRFGGVGQGEGARQNFITRQVAKIPLVFNIKISAPFRQLITSAKGYYDPSLLIEQNLPALMRAEEERKAREQQTDVQRLESEPVR